MQEGLHHLRRGIGQTHVCQDLDRCRVDIGDISRLKGAEPAALAFECLPHSIWLGPTLTPL